MIWILALLLQAPWADLVPTVQASVPRVEIQKQGQTGICSAVVFLVDGDGFAHALTAGHCVQKSSESERIDLTVNGRTAVVTHSNGILDLAVLKFRRRDEAPIQLAAAMPKAGTQVAVVGYAFGVEELVAQFGFIAQSYNRESKTTWINADLIFGDSGGPALDATGKLVGVNSRIYYNGPAHIAAVVTVDALRDYLDAYDAELKKAAQRR
jgi:S1-C subfamily serine protease